MKVEELRIGNWVFNDRVKNRIENLLSDGICTLKTPQGNFIHAQYSLIQPVPLTGEILIKAGFELFPWGYVFNGILLHHNHKGKFWIELGNGKRINLDYVHDLQNFFVLTSEELEIKL